MDRNWSVDLSDLLFRWFVTWNADQQVPCLLSHLFPKYNNLNIGLWHCIRFYKTEENSSHFQSLKPGDDLLSDYRPVCSDSSDFMYEN